MKNSILASSIALGVMTSLAAVSPTMAANIDDPNSVAWSSIRGYSSADFGKYFQQKKAQGYRVIDLEVDRIGGKTRYSAVWQYNSDKRGWASYRNMTNAQFSQRWKDFRKQGYRLIDQESYKIGGKRLYAGVWVQNKENTPWVSYRNVDSAAFSKRFKTYQKQGYRMVDVEAYPSGSKTLYSAIWVKNQPNLGWAEYRNMSASSYAKRFKDFQKQGYRVADLESYRQGGRQKYAAIWVKNTNGRGWAARRDMSATWFGNYWKTYRDQGYRLVDFEAYPTIGGTRYAGVWRQNNDRRNWSGRTGVDQAIAAYKKRNGLPGISVVIQKHGKTLYARGFGYADTIKKKVAHADTIYRLASVSKPITGLLAMRQVEQRRLNLDAPTRRYLPSMPGFHTHKIRQLMNHQSGICHYAECGSGWRGQTFNTAFAAIQKYEKQPLLFTPGTKVDYSTHAFSVLAAVLEKRSGRSYSALFTRDITNRLGLPTLRPENRKVKNANRSLVYSGAVPVPADNLSWKFAGGGIESSAVDLTKLGTKLLQGRVISNASRTQMWTNSTLNNGNRSGYGLVWSLGSHRGKAIASHGGAQLGARSHWRIYRNDGIVISILSNRNNGNPSGLADQIGTIVLNAR
ncbi:serine hydrolase [filamentous cyanobacterium LEGE 11480]|uniref:Serine hydrolase n=1 Tax=Romeriopsis navalis LEGE 11480 TaxID=2777977 RepID=A0A928Z463_9CYAN|nr:serine hydrolase [Romeriopsis navalis]MBE9030003.1 serine hydrolase [Romeriopsis navalis LEGE 11480]